ncbi:heterodisulfide reductase subunit C [Desulfitispora alkaliphila]|uniref:4Fe-4S dicluster domain-containing protein n=1 Tax=Desulfitispora alkaliphila TaxID=622674 RepID=UPI003D211675
METVFNEHSFYREVKQLPGCENISDCIQCGTCSGSCPTCYEMELTPRKIINLIRAGEREQVLSSNSMWICASCYSCTARCPRGIVITDMMYALKNLAITSGATDSKAEAPNFYCTFNEVVESSGRMNEGMLITKFALKTNPKKLFDYAPIGIKLLKKKKLVLFPPRLKNRAQFKKIVALSKGGDGN